MRVMLSVHICDCAVLSFGVVWCPLLCLDVIKTDVAAVTCLKWLDDVNVLVTSSHDGQVKVNHNTTQGDGTGRDQEWATANKWRHYKPVDSVMLT